MEDPLQELSSEQAILLDKLEDGYNVQLVASPGCGKSRSIIQIAAAFPQKNILVISYNKALVKAINASLCNIQQRQQNQQKWAICKTYHGLLQSVTHQTVKDDIMMKKVLRTTNFAIWGPLWRYKNFDILIVDEAQDMRKRYFQVVCELGIHICQNPSQLLYCIFGDFRQVLYSFYASNKADARFLTLAQFLFARISPRKWYVTEFTVSYRVTPQIANFLNALVPSRRLIAGRSSSLVDWVTLYIADVYKQAPQIVYDIVKQEQHRLGTKLHDILVLCASLNENSPAVRIVDLLVANGVSVHVERSGTLVSSLGDSSTNHEDILCNKVNFKTMCASKGLQSPIVIFINLSELLAEEFVTNQKFVGLSRANKRLYVVQNAFYTCTADIQRLQSELKQRDLRIIYKHPVPSERKKRSAEQEGTILTKNALHVASLFCFLDVDHMDLLLQHISFETIVRSCLEEEEEEERGEEKKEEEKSEKDEDDDKISSCQEAYFKALTKTFDNGTTHTSLVSICGLAFQLAFEVWIDARIPSMVSSALDQIRMRTDPKFKIMQTLFYDALDEIGLLLKQQEDDVVTPEHLWTIMPSFAKLAVALDALRGYRELLHSVSSFMFIQCSEVQRRFYALCENLQFLVHDAGILAWHQSEIGRYVHEQQPLQLTACPAIVSEAKTLMVHFSNNLNISYEDRLKAVAEAIVVNPTGFHNMNVYVMNLMDASVEKVKLISEPYQQQELEEKRFKPCTFLDDAVRYKMLPRAEEDNGVENNPLDQTLFLEEMDQVVQAVLDNQHFPNTDENDDDVDL